VSNEKTASTAIGVVLGVGIVLSITGAYQWRDKIQKQGNRIKQ
jgi:hypothetical protein